MPHWISSGVCIVPRYQLELIKQNSDSRLIIYHHQQHHKGTGCTRDILPLPLVQETTLSAVALDSELTPPPIKATL
jgi:capsule polysaccharide export protein KpsC/LpsZ